MSSKVSIRVPQSDGEIVINKAGDVTKYKVDDSLIQVKEADVAHVLVHVPGAHRARVARDSTDTSKPEDRAKDGAINGSESHQ